MNNPVGWFEIYVADMTRAKVFYEKVFGVQLSRLENTETEIWAFSMTQETYGASGALVHMPGVPVRQGGVLVYFSCDDCAVEAAKAVAAGGSLEKPKTSIGSYGHIALFSDTEGNMIGLHSMR